MPRRPSTLPSEAPTEEFAIASPTLDQAPIDPQDSRPWRRRSAMIMIGLALLAIVAVLADLPGPVRALLVGAAMLVVPGAAALPWRDRIDPWARAAIVVPLSMVIATALALVSIWTRWWHPLVIGVLVLIAAAGVLFVRDVYRRGAIVRADRERRPLSQADVVAAVGLVVAATCWIVGLATTSGAPLGEWGLLAAFGPAWFVGLGINLGVLIWALIALRAPRTGWLAAHTALLVLILYGSASLLAEVPRLPWVYKHIAVTRYLELHGAVDPTIDIYQRWPGFFAWTAQLAPQIGLPDPVAWARWAEPGFMIIDVLLLVAIARTFSPDRRWAWTAATIYCLTNWVAQNYYAPQALGFTLFLLIALVLLTALRSAPRPFGAWLETITARVFRAGRPRPVPPPRVADSSAQRPSRVWVMVVVLLSFAVIVTSHQLTPYVALLALVPLFLIGYLRPLLLVAGMALIAVAYLIPNFDYVQEHFGLFSGFDPVANAVYSPIDRSALLPGAVWQARGTQLISGITYLLAAIGLVRRVRSGAARSALMVGWLLVAPALLLAVQSYGGEGRLRVFLFSLPWAVLAAAWAFRPAGQALRRWTQAAVAASLALLAVLFTLSYYQPEAGYRVAKADVTAAQWMDAQAESGDVILPTGPTFPVLVGPRYDLVGLDGALSDYKRYFPGALTLADVRTVAENLAGAGGPRAVYLIFSPAQDRYAGVHGLYADGELTGLEKAVQADPASRLAFDSDGVRIYRIGT